jgi:nitrogen regulatory protein PII
MQNHLVKPAKMLICFMGRHRGERLVAAAKTAGARGGTLALGQSLGCSRLLQALSLGDVQQDVVFTVTGDEGPAVLAAVKAAAARDPKKLAGTAVVVDVPELFIRASGAPADPAEQKRSEPMESGYKLITVIVNTGYGDDVMAAARKAGATGGTIINARGTGTEEDVKFFGITLVPEKEMLLIVANKDRVEPIARAIATVPTLAEPGGGIIFSTNVEEFIILGQHKTWKEE